MVIYDERIQVVRMIVFTKTHRCEIAVATSSEISVAMTQSHVFMYFTIVLLVEFHVRSQSFCFGTNEYIAQGESN